MTHHRPALHRRRWLAALALGWTAGPLAWAADTLVLASTTSTEQSGLFAHLLPRLQADTGLQVKVVAVGTGQALDLARRGDADALLVHDPEAEQRFMAEGWGKRRLPVMHNRFVLVGPADDPANVHGITDAVQAMARIAQRQAPFVSRGDRSGTHMAELRLWAQAHVDVQQPRPWRRVCGCGMGSALNMAAAIGAYTLADVATWLAFRNPAALRVLLQGDARLRNPYHIIVVDPARHPHVRAQAAQRLADWLTGPRGQQAIADFRLQGQPVFEPVAPPPR